MQLDAPFFFAKPTQNALRRGPDGFSHHETFATVCMSSTCGGFEGVKALGADNVRLHATTQHLFSCPCIASAFPDAFQVLKNRSEIVRDGTLVSKDMRGPFHGAAEFMSVSKPSGKSSTTTHTTDHIIKNIIPSGSDLPRSVAARLKMDAGMVHGQAMAELTDNDPALFLTLPVGCLIEEITLVEGHAEQESQLTQMLIEVFHVDQEQVKLPDSRAERSLTHGQLPVVDPLIPTC